MTRWDAGVWAGLVAVFAGLVLLAAWPRPAAGETGPRQFKIVSPAGVRFLSSQDTRVRVEGPAGGMVVEIREGRARVIEAGCPGGRCLRMGPVETPDDPPILCLPNRTSIRAVGGGARRRLDGVTG